MSPEYLTRRVLTASEFLRAYRDGHRDQLSGHDLRNQRELEDLVSRFTSGSTAVPPTDTAESVRESALPSGAVR